MDTVGQSVLPCLSYHVGLSIHLSTWSLLSKLLSLCPFVHLSGLSVCVHPSNGSLFCPSVYLSVSPSIHPLVCWSVHLSVCQSVRLSVFLSIWKYIRVSVHLSLCPYVYP